MTTAGAGPLGAGAVHGSSVVLRAEETEGLCSSFMTEILAKAEVALRTEKNQGGS